MKLQALLLWGSLLLGLGLVNWSAMEREQLATHGQVMFFKLEPVDPRSLLQGDYMQLRYDTTPIRTDTLVSRNGLLVVELDPLKVARFDRVYTPGTPLAADEHLVAYHVRNGQIWVGSDSFFFQEGHASRYEDARYAELHVSPAGEPALIGLRDHRLSPLGR